MKDDQKIYSPDCVPEGFSLSDPEHLTGFKISNLYHHWLYVKKENAALLLLWTQDLIHQIFVRKSEKLKGKKKKYEPASSFDEHEDEGSSNIGDGGKKKEKEFEGKEGLDDEDEHHPLPKFRPLHGSQGGVLMFSWSLPASDQH